MTELQKLVTDNKVLIVCLTNRMGGAEQMLLMIANTIQSPLVFLRKVCKYNLPFKDGQEVTFVTRKPLIIGFILLIKALYKYRSGFIIISSHAYVNAFLGFLKRIGYLRSKIIVRESTSLFSRYKGIKRLTYKIAYRIGYPVVEKIICQTDLMRDELLQNNPFIPKSKVFTLDNAIDLSSVKIKGEEIFVDPVVPKEFLCSAGRLIKIKGFELLIKAFKEIIPFFPNLNLVILGEGPERESLERLIDELNLKGRVILKGHIDNPYPYFFKARACVVSSIKEGFPNVLLQMMALNTRIVCTVCTDGIERIPLITKVRPLDIPDLQQGILKVLDDDTSGAREIFDSYLMRRNPKTYINELFKELA